MMDAIIGEVKLFAIEYVPSGFYRCDGSLLSITPENQVLYDVIGKTYGSTAPTNFALPNFQGRTALGAGSGAALTPRSLAHTGGTETITLTLEQIPTHHHTFSGRSGNPSTRRAIPNETSFLANFAVTPTGGIQTAVNGYAPVSSKTRLNIHQDSIGQGMGNDNGSTAPHENRQPYLVVDFYICYDGIVPTWD